MTAAILIPDVPIVLKSSGVPAGGTILRFAGARPDSLQKHLHNDLRRDSQRELLRDLQSRKSVQNDSRKDSRKGLHKDSQKAVQRNSQKGLHKNLQKNRATSQTQNPLPGPRQVHPTARSKGFFRADFNANRFDDHSKVCPPTVLGIRRPFRENAPTIPCRRFCPPQSSAPDNRTFTPEERS